MSRCRLAPVWLGNPAVALVVEVVFSYANAMVFAGSLFRLAGTTSSSRCMLPFSSAAAALVNIGSSATSTSSGICNNTKAKSWKCAWPAAAVHRQYFVLFCIVAQSTRSGAFSTTRTTSSISRTAVGGRFLHQTVGNCINSGPHLLKARRYCSTAGSSDGEQVGLPKYIEDELAVVFFSNPYFYANEECANYLSDLRTEILGVMTMREVVQRWKFEDEQKTLAESIGAAQSKVVKALPPASVEDKLNREVIVAINGLDEIKTLHAYYVPGVPSVKIAVSSVKTDSLQKRPRPIYLVMGPSGSGKTFISVKEVATHGVAELGHSKQVTLYVQPNRIYAGAEESLKNGLLMARIQEWLTDQFGYDPNHKLKMHVTIVLDQIYMDDHFDNEGKFLITLFDEHMVKFADSVRLVACGALLTGKHLVTNFDCYKIHLNKWSREDVAVVLARRLDKNPNHVLNAIFDHSVLAALTTNARAARYVLDQVILVDTRLTSSKDKQGKLSNILRTAVPLLLETVVANYAAMNGLQGLNTVYRRHVAAFVFGAVEDANDRSRLRSPDFEGMHPSVATAAWSLLNHNIEYSSVKKQKPRLVRLNERPILISPAIAVVLFTMLGGTATILPAGKAQDQIAALHAFRQEVLKILQRFRSNPEKSLAMFQLDKELEALELVHVRERVRSPTSFIVPRMAKSAIWINGENAPFADVIAPYKLIQCKPTSIVGKTERVDLSYDLGKCGLLRNRNNGTVVKSKSGQVAVRAIWFMWSDEYNNRHTWNLNYHGERNKDPSVSLETKQESLAFPENIIDRPTIGDHFESVTVLLRNGKWWIRDGTESVEVPELSCIFKPGKPRVSFVISTDAPRVVVVDGVSGKPLCELCKDQLHEDSRVNVDLLETRYEKDAWKKLEATIVDGVDVKFLFT